MISLIIEKELRDVLGSSKFLLSFLVCAILILLTFAAGARNYQAALAQYEAARAEELRTLEGLSSWLEMRQHRIFLPPQPLGALVGGVSNDVGRTIDVRGRGELVPRDSRFNDEPLFAVFRFLDLDFLFQIVLTLFAILFGYDAISGEKERGTLRLTLANAVPRARLIVGKFLGLFIGLAVPLLAALLAGCLLLPVLGIRLTGAEWVRLAAVIGTGLLLFAVFLALSMFVSALTRRSSHSFAVLLMAWIFAVLIIPRAAVAVAGRAVDVPSVDAIASQKSKYSRQLFTESRERMTSFKPTPGLGMDETMQEFNKFMQSIADERERKMLAFSAQLNEQRTNRQAVQQRVAFSLARFSPAACFSLAAMDLAGTSLSLNDRFVQDANRYQRAYANFMIEKTGINPGGNMVIMRHGDDADGKGRKPSINAAELPVFQYSERSPVEYLAAGAADIGLLSLFTLLLFAGAFTAFLRYDAR